MLSQAPARLFTYKKTQVVTIEEEKVIEKVEQFFAELKNIALLPELANEKIMLRDITYTRDNDQQNAVITNEQFVTIRFPDETAINECKSTQDLMNKFSHPFKHYLAKYHQAILNKQMDVPLPIAKFLNYWRKLKELDLPVLGDQEDNIIATHMSKIGYMLDESLIEEIRSNKEEKEIVKAVDKFVANGGNVNQFIDFTFPIFEACTKKLATVVSKLLESGAGVDSCVKNFSVFNNEFHLIYPLEKAFFSGCKEIVDSILAKHLEKRDAEGLNATLAKILNYNIPRIEETYYLDSIKKMMTVLYAIDPNGLNKFELRIFRVSELVKYYLEITKKSKEQIFERMLTLCAQSQDSEILKRLYEIYGIEKVSQVYLESNETLLISTLRSNIYEDDGNVRTCFYDLLAHNIDVNIPELKTGITPLMIAACKGDDRKVKLLLKSKADSEQVDGNGKTALMYALDAVDDKESVVRELLLHSPTKLAQESKRASNLSLESKSDPILAAFMMEFEKDDPDKTVLKLLFEHMQNKQPVIDLFWENVCHNKSSKIAYFGHLFGDEVLTMKNYKGETAPTVAVYLNNIKVFDELCLFVHGRANSLLLYFMKEGNEKVCNHLLDYRGALVEVYGCNAYYTELAKKHGLSDDFINRIKPQSQCRIM